MTNTSRQLDRRSTRRRQVTLSGRLQFQGGTAWKTCTVVNITPMGAMLILPEPMTVPREVRLQIPDNFFDVAGLVQHQDRARIGIEFSTNRMEALARYW